ncbi:tRNA-specific 2-thiouridylase MnmA [uncultured Desulfatiglans sp.]|uniref:tRNA-specific 2-thiouridylase MnmA n=1 Tax=Uncultured Desulfatiglans sp. TaxID=1748965 RepID=A0A653AG14_UNCDX|nr:tRNA-specific 2-thiouridylase MnmA [uncultured Desulfatiglans sp.]
MNPPIDILVAVSGGVDSAVAAALLKREGRRICAVHFLLPGPETAREALIAKTRRICGHLGIPLVLRDVREAFDREVITPFRAAYLGGLTPNPCVLCNERVKFPQLVDEADRMGAPSIATGHYAVLTAEDGRPRLGRGADPGKEQSYFLHRLSAAILARTRFPLGRMMKAEVEREAVRLGLPVEPGHESQEICFLGGEDYRHLIQEGNGRTAAPGRIIDIRGAFVGAHSGAYRYTIGQRHGLGIASPRPYYVLEIRAQQNEVVVGRREDLYSSNGVAEDFVWKGGIKPIQGKIEVLAQIRYRHKAAPAVLEMTGSKRVSLTFREPQWAVTPGQALVCYDGETVLGGGWIVRPPQS